MNQKNISFGFHSCSYTLAVSIINGYIHPVISVFGIFLNFLSVIVFLQILKKNKDYSSMFKYLLIKSLDNGMRSIINSFATFNYCLNCEYSRSYATLIWFIYFFIYVARSLEMCSSFMDVMATFECYIGITGKFKILHSKNIPNIIIPLVHIFSLIFSIHYLFRYKIVPSNLINVLNETKYYKHDFTEFHYTDIGFMFRLLESGLTHITPFVLLFLINCLIILTFRNTSVRKLKLNQNIHQSNSVKMALKVEKKIQIMIVLSGVNFMIGHVGMILFSFNLPVSEQFQICFVNFYNSMYSFSLIINIFFYYFYNNHFRHQILINLRWFGYKYRQNVLESTYDNKSKHTI